MRRWLVLCMAILLVGLGAFPTGRTQNPGPQPPLSVCPRRDPGPNSGWVRIPQDTYFLAEAVEKAKAQGDLRVWIGPGLYNISHFSMPDAVIFLDGNFIICGMGPDFTILEAEEVADGFLRIYGEGEVILEGFTITGGRNAVQIIGQGELKVIFNKFRVFATDEYQAIQVYSPRAKVLLYESELIGNPTGIDIVEGKEVTIWRTLISGSWAEGVRITAIDRRTQLIIRESRISGNGTGGILIGGKPQITLINSEIAHNGGDGVDIGDSSRLEAIDNRIFSNQGCGILAGAKEAEVLGRGNEIRDNEKGDLCPPDFPWPPGFVKP